MKLTITDIIALFPIAPSNMPGIGTEQPPPTHHSIKHFKDKLYLQAIAIPTQEGDATLGHIYQVLTDNEYVEISHNKKVDETKYMYLLINFYNIRYYKYIVSAILSSMAAGGSWRFGQVKMKLCSFVFLFLTQVFIASQLFASSIASIRL